MTFKPALSSTHKPLFALADPRISKEEFDDYWDKVEKGELRRPTREELDDFYRAIKAALA